MAFGRSARQRQQRPRGHGDLAALRVLDIFASNTAFVALAPTPVVALLAAEKLDGTHDRWIIRLGSCAQQPAYPEPGSVGKADPPVPLPAPVRPLQRAYDRVGARDRRIHLARAFDAEALTEARPCRREPLDRRRGQLYLRAVDHDVAEDVRGVECL